MLEQEEKGLGQILRVHPREPLAAASDGPPHELLEKGDHLTQCPSSGAQYYPEPGYRHPCPFLLGFEGLSLPFRGNRRQEVVSRRRISVSSSSSWKP